MFHTTGGIFTPDSTRAPKRGWRIRPLSFAREGWAMQVFGRLLLGMIFVQIGIILAFVVGTLGYALLTAR